MTMALKRKRTTTRLKQKTKKKMNANDDMNFGYSSMKSFFEKKKSQRRGTNENEVVATKQEFSLGMRAPVCVRVSIVA